MTKVVGHWTARREERESTEVIASPLIREHTSHLMLPLVEGESVKIAYQSTEPSYVCSRSISGAK
jgi:hypothetical protein